MAKPLRLTPAAIRLRAVAEPMMPSPITAMRFAGIVICRSALHDRLAAHVAAAAEQQRRLVGVGEALDMTDEDDVVAAVTAELLSAPEMGHPPAATAVRHLLGAAENILRHLLSPTWHLQRRVRRQAEQDAAEHRAVDVPVEDVMRVCRMHVAEGALQRVACINRAAAGRLEQHIDGSGAQGRGIGAIAT